MGIRKRVHFFSSFDTGHRMDSRNLERTKEREVKDMWAFQQMETHLWIVGFFRPDGVWFPQIEFKTREEAAAYLNYLYGGDGQVWKGTN